MARYIGLMSGTSLDGVDAVLCEDAPAAPQAATGPGALRELAFFHLEYGSALRAELLALNGRGGDELHRASLASQAVARAYAEAVTGVLRLAGLPPTQVSALGAHGQTVRHQPGQGYTVQLLNAALLAELSGIDVICDFRSRDVAAGGQGAPLVPAFHAACFGQPDQDMAVLNIGGIANLTLLPAQGPVTGFDTGPGNLLMDAWAARHLGQPFDADGAFAAQGQVQAAWLEQLLADPFFTVPPPKSTGRDLFDPAWLARHLAGQETMAPADAMATLTMLTARSAIDALKQHLARANSLLVCGGGTRNASLMAMLQSLSPGVAVRSTADAGVDPQHVEALAFAWLARAFVARQPGNLAAVTGAPGPRVLGALYPGRLSTG